ncbi:MAG: TIGR02266 family protein [Desulfuromonadaceae bacterium]|nr:TIGR02266 family protein [Desulfuromonadaceae bacterium]
MNREKVLLVDDVAPFLELERSFFDEKRFDVLTACSALEAVRLVSRQPPGIIFMDLHMGDMDGDEACALIKKDPLLKHIPIILVTHPDEDDIEKCEASGCEGYVFKPVKKGDFMEMTNRFLGDCGRQAPRVRARLVISYGTEGDTRTLQRYSVNMSTGGVFLETEEVLPENTPLVLAFILPGEKRTVSCRGRVAWVNPPHHKANPDLTAGMGIQFVGLQFEEISAIRNYLHQISQESLHELVREEENRSSPLA